MEPVKKIMEMLRDNKSQVVETSHQTNITPENLTTDKSKYSREKIMSQELSSDHVIETPADNT